MSDKWQLLPALTDAEYGELKASIARVGVQVPIEVDQESGLVLDGHHRAQAVAELRAEGVRVPEPPKAVRLFRSDDERIEHVLTLNLARRHLSAPQRRQVVSALRGPRVVAPAHRGRPGRPPRDRPGRPRSCRKSDT